MRSAVASFLVLAALTAVLFVGDGREVAGETPIPTPTERVTQADITLRFYRDHQPMTLTFERPAQAEVGGVVCELSGGTPGETLTFAEFTFVWPPSTSSREPCGRDGPKVFHIGFNVDQPDGTTTSFRVAFMWEGGNQSFSYDLPEPLEGQIRPRAFAEKYLAPVRVINTLEGVPIGIATGPIGYAVVDGMGCSALVLAIVFFTVTNTTSWPFGRAPHCQEIGASVSICEHPDYCASPFVFDGSPSPIMVEMAWPRVPGAHVVTARFSHMGEVREVTLGSWTFYIDGVQCTGGSDRGGTVTAALSHYGFFRDIPACDAVGKEVVAVFQNVGCEEASGTFIWNNEDVTVDIDVGPSCGQPVPTTPSLTASASPSPPTPTPVPSPAAVPAFGGSPGGGASVWRWAIALASMAAVTFVVTRLRGAQTGSNS